MLEVSGNMIQLTRGDTMILELSLVDETGDKYVPDPADVIIFRVKRNSTSKEILIEKNISPEDMVLKLDEADTKDLKFGTYYYEVEIITGEDYHFTVIANTEFEITTELENHG